MMMPKINPSGQSVVKRAKNECRLVVTFEIEFSDEAMQKAPAHHRQGVDIMRDMLTENKDLSAEVWLEAFKKDLAVAGLSDLVAITDIKLEASP